MPKFINEAHRRKWSASIRRAWARRKAAMQEPKDVLSSGGQLGKKDEFTRAKESYLKHHGLNGEIKEALKALRVERIRADARVTAIDTAIRALEGLPVETGATA